VGVELLCAKADEFLPPHRSSCTNHFVLEDKRDASSEKQGGERTHGCGAARAAVGKQSAVRKSRNA